MLSYSYKAILPLTASNPNHSAYDGFYMLCTGVIRVVRAWELLPRYRIVCCLLRL